MAWRIIWAFFNIHRMISAAGAVAYPREEGIGAEERGGGAIAYAGAKGEVRNDQRGMAEARALGRAVVRTIQRYKDSGLL